MEEYITRTEFIRYVEQVKEEMRQLREQRTEEMKAIRVDVASKDVLDRLDDLKQEMTQELKTVSDTWLETMQEHYTEHTARFEKIEGALTRSESSMATKEDLKAMATKQDLTNLVDTMEERFRDLLIKYLRPGGNGH